MTYTWRSSVTRSHYDSVNFDTFDASIRWIHLSHSR